MHQNSPKRLAGASTARRGALAAMVGCAAILGLMWIDVLPGGWTLRGWVEPHACREARARRLHSEDQLRLFAEQNLTAPEGSIIFAGSSTIERFPLQEIFPGAPTQNRGIGDETCEEFLARLAASRPSAPPAMWVLYMGSLDFRRLGEAPAVILPRIERALQAVRASNADLPLVLIGILPEQSMPDPMVQRLSAINSGLTEICARLDVAFVDTGRAPLTDANGSLNPEFAADRLHLNRKGYRILADWICESSPALAKLLVVE